MIIAQVSNFVVTNMYNLPSIPPEFMSGMGSIYHNLEDNPLGIGIGWRYVGGDFLEPLDVSSSFGRVITTLAYRRRFTQTERVTIKLASRGQIEGITDAMAAAIDSNLDDLIAAGYVHLDRADTVEGTHGLELAGLIGAGRAIAILAPPVYSNEIRSEVRVHYGLPSIPTERELMTNGGKGYTTVDQFFKDNPEYTQV